MILNEITPQLIWTDHIGRPVFGTKINGQPEWGVVYRPFGGVESVSGTPIDLGFPGQWFHVDTGLYQNWTRDYDRTTGSYIQPDPLGLIDGPAVYRYARSSPLGFVDPRGENPRSTLGGDDSGFDSDKATTDAIDDARRTIEDPEASQRDKSRARRRIRELLRSLSRRGHQNLFPPIILPPGWECLIINPVNPEHCLENQACLQNKSSGYFIVSAFPQIRRSQ